MHSLAWLLLAIGTLCFTAPSLADESEQKEKARVQLATGDGLLSKGDRLMAADKVGQALEEYEAALNAYKKAYRILPDKKIFFPIAMAEQKLGRFTDALEHFQALKDADLELSDAIKEQIDDGLEITKDNLVGFSPVVWPDGASIYVDGKKIGNAPLSKVIYVSPGVHRYAVRKEGFEGQEGSFDRSRGAVERPQLKLRSLSSTHPGDPSKTRNPKKIKTPTPMPKSSVSKTPLWIGLGATVIFAGAATATGLQATSKKNRVQDTSLSLDERTDAQSSGETLALVTDGLIAGAVVAGLFTTYYYFGKVRSGEDVQDELETDFAISPYLSPESSGFVVRGQF